MSIRAVSNNMPYYQYADEYAFRVNLNKLLFEQMESVQNKPMNWHLKCWRQYLKTVHNIKDVPLEATTILETICKHTKAKEMFEHLKGIKQLIIKDRQLIEEESESDESEDQSESEESDVENDDIESDADETSDDDESADDDESDDDGKESDDDEDEEETEEESDQSDTPMDNE